jgi:hypothetical protein
VSQAGFDVRSTDAVEGVAEMMENRKPACRGELAAKRIGRRFIADWNSEGVG